MSCDDNWKKTYFQRRYKGGGVEGVEQAWLIGVSCSFQTMQDITIP